MVREQLALARRPGRRAPVEAVLEDRLDQAVGAGADVETAVAARLQPLDAIMARQPQDADAGSVALFGCGRLSRISAVKLAVHGPIAAASARMRSIVQSA